MVNQGCFSQAIDTIPDIKGEVDGFMKLNDGVIKREIAFFNIASSFTTETDSFPKIKVNEIPLLTCTDSSASFSDSNIKSKFMAQSLSRADTSLHMSNPLAHLLFQR